MTAEGEFLKLISGEVFSQRNEPSPLGIEGRDGVTFIIVPSGGDPLKILVRKGGETIVTYRGLSLDTLQANNREGKVLRKIPLGDIKRRKTVFGVTFVRG